MLPIPIYPFFRKRSTWTFVAIIMVGKPRFESNRDEPNWEDKAQEICFFSLFRPKLAQRIGAQGNGSSDPVLDITRMSINKVRRAASEFQHFKSKNEHFCGLQLWCKEWYQHCKEWCCFSFPFCEAFCCKIQKYLLTTNALLRVKKEEE